MSNDPSRSRNMSYLGLNDEQYDRHCELMGMPIKKWPQSLKTYCEKQDKVMGFCGNAMACWVADWIKAGEQEPFDLTANESAEEEEEGRKEALRLLENISQKRA
jgi:hypothetical protein